MQGNVILRQKSKMSDRSDSDMICIYNETPLIQLANLILKYSTLIGQDSTNKISVLFF